MKRSALEIYAFAVCFFSAAYFVFVVAESLWHTVELSVPEFTMPAHDWERHQSDEAFRESLVAKHKYGEKNCDYEPPAGPELTTERERSFRYELRAEQRLAVQQLARNLITVFILVTIFAIHWRIASRARQSDS